MTFTGSGDTVLDTFAGSNTTASAAEKLDRRWLAFEKDRTRLAASALRFVDELHAELIATLWSQPRSQPAQALVLGTDPEVLPPRHFLETKSDIRWRLT